ncbi:MAG: glycine hydroxymethyltransferase [Chloroflexi bacterium]|nr:glycine hydroxymethyltransferase [Chloroflexota bacterium]
MAVTALSHYLQRTARSGAEPDPELVAYIAALQQIATVSPEVARSIVDELADQRSNLKLIASENYCSIAVQLAMGNLLTDKYAEGFPRHRFYAGCENVDAIEQLAVEEARQLFGADHAYVQPHSGADANLVAYWTILSQRVQAPMMERLGQTDPQKLTELEWSEIRTALGNQRLLGMNIYSGGHLTHGYRLNISSRMFDSRLYDVNRETRLLDYDEIRAQAREFKPLILLAGYSAYSRLVNFRVMKQIADEVGAVLMVDMAHFAGLVAGKVFTGEYDPVAYADVVTTTTHKTLRGPRGGMVLCKQEFAEQLDKGCPLVLGGPLPHVMAAKAVAFKEANSAAFRTYAARIVENAAALARSCMDEGMDVLTGGTDNHLMLLDLTAFGLNGRQAEPAMREAGITLNRNTVPFDPNGPWYTSGLRFGTPAVTTLGMGTAEMAEIAGILKLVLSNTRPAVITAGDNAGSPSKARYEIEPRALADARARATALLDRFPLYPNLDLDALRQAAG